MADFPGIVGTKPTTIADGLTILASHVDLAWEEILAIEEELLGTGTGFTLNLKKSTSGDNAITAKVVGDTHERLVVAASGATSWGSGSAAGDVTLSRSAARTLTLAGSAVVNVTQAADVGLLVKGASGQSANLASWTDNSNAVLASVSSAGLVSASSLSVAGASTLTGTTTAGVINAGSLSTSGNAQVTGTLGVTGASTLAAVGATSGTFSSTLAVTGTSTMAAVNAGAVGATALTVSGTSALAVTTASSVTTTGLVQVGTTLGVTGTSTLAGVNASSVTVTGAISVGTTLGVTGGTSLAGLTATGKATIGSAATSDWSIEAINRSGYRHQPTSGNPSFSIQRSGDTQPRFQVRDDGSASGSAILEFFTATGSGGTDATLYRDTAARLRTDGSFRADGLITKAKAGMAVDGDFTATPVDGAIAVDTDNKQLTFRANGTWHGTRTEYTQTFLMMGA